MGEIISGMDARARERQTRMVTRRFATNKEADAAGCENWPPVPDEDRAELAWQLSLEAWSLTDPTEDEPGLRRSVTRVVRR